MKNVQGLVLCLLISFSGIALPAFVVAQTSPASSSPPTLLATVNIQNATYTQNGNTLSISFDLTNRIIPQEGVLYSVMLVGSTTQAQFIADQKVYNDPVSLPEHSRVHKSITYTAPASLSGTYDIILQAKNASGFPFGVDKIGTITLKATKGIDLEATSCYLTISDDKTQTKYGLLQGVDIAPSESLILHCSAHNNGAAISATPAYETHYRTPYGNVVSATGGDVTPISFDVNQTKSISLTLPKATDPQAYDVLVMLGDSNPIDAHYVIQGDSATIENLTLDKNYYKAGDTANATYLWSGPADSFPGSRRYAPYATSSKLTTAAATSTTGLTAYAILQDGAGNDCAASMSQPAAENQQPRLSFTIMRDCRDPHLTVELKDPSGNVVAKGEITMTSPSNNTRNSELVLGLGILVLLVGGVVYWRTRYGK